MMCYSIKIKENSIVTGNLIIDATHQVSNLLSFSLIIMHIRVKKKPMTQTHSQPRRKRLCFSPWKVWLDMVVPNTNMILNFMLKTFRLHVIMQALTVYCK